MADNSISVIIPAHNEARNIRETVTSALYYADEVIVIDDGSIDSTSEIARNAGARIVRHTTQRGYIAAIKTGYNLARGNISVILDGDGEFPAEKIPLLVSPIKQNKADMVQGHRTLIPRLSEKFLNWLANRIEFVGDSGSGFRAIRTDIAKRLKLNGVCICGVFTLEVISKGGRLEEIPITLHSISKPRKIAWFHLKQFFYILPWFLKK